MTIPPKLIPLGKLKRVLFIALLVVFACEDKEEQIESKFSNLAWAAYKYDTDWNSTLEKWEYKAHCFYVDATNQCAPLEGFLSLNSYVKDTIQYHQWTEIRLPDNQHGLNEVTIELIGWNGLVNPYSGIEYYEYIED